MGYSQESPKIRLCPNRDEGLQSFVKRLFQVFIRVGIVHPK
jgi:hypothetical protein